MTDLGLLQKHVDAADRELRAGYFERPPAAELEALPAEKRLAEHDHGWALFAHALRAQVPGCAEARNLQLAASPREPDWDAAEYGDHHRHAAADSLAEAGSARRPGRSFSDRYGRWLHDVAPAAYEEGAWHRARAAVEAAGHAERAHRELARAVAREWRRFDDRQRGGSPPSHWLSIEEWYDRTGSHRALAAGDDALAARWSIALLLLRAACRSADEPLLRAFERFQGAERRLLKVPRAGSERPAELRRVRPYEVAGRSPRRDAGGAPVSFRLSADGPTHDYARSAVAGGVGIGFGFFGVPSGGERVGVDLDTRRPGFRLDVSARFESGSLAPGAWHDAEAWRRCREGPFVPGSAMDQLARRGALFGPRGFLGFRPIRAVVAREVRLRLELPHAEYHHLKSVVLRSGALFVGPFVASREGSQAQRLRFDDRTRTLEIRGARQPAQLVAMDHEEL